VLIRFPDEKFALAVSGGSDSMAMLLLAWKQERAFTVLTVDHGLREESLEEAEQVKAWCAVRKIPHVILSIAGPKPKSGIQAWARKARYDAMTRWCAENGVKTLLTAHTLNDQAETVAMRRTRTASNRSLAGIWPETEWSGIRISRPLLGETREALREVLRLESVSWTEDPSNHNPAFERVRVRQALSDHEIVGLAEIAKAAQMEVRTLDASARSFINTHVKCDEYGLIYWDRLEFLALGEDVQHAVLRWAIEAAGGNSDYEAASVAALADALKNNPKRGTLGGAIIVARKKQVLVGREPARISEISAVPDSGQILWDQRFLIKAPPGSTVSAAGPKCPRPIKQVPAFVLAGLPKVVLPEGTEVTPHFSPHSAISVCKSERFVT
jgi:tRNA(Ile)-lysidine synthase